MKTMSKYQNFKSTSAIPAIMFAAMLGMSAVATAEPLGGLGGLGGAVGGALGGVGGTVGGALGGVGGALGGVTGGVGNAVGNVGNTVSNALGSTGATGLSSPSASSKQAKSNALSGIRGKLKVLSPQELAKLCLATGGGSSGCGSGSKPKILGLIDARLKLLNGKQLLSLCLSVGGGCGNSRVVVKPPTDDPPRPPRDKPDRFASKDAIKKLNCATIRRSPQMYDEVIVAFCRGKS